MAQFLFEAVDRGGRRTKGRIQANSPSEGRLLLRQQGLELISFQKALWSVAASWSRSEQIQFIEQLRQLLEAGLPLFEALQSMEQRSRGTKEHPILQQLVTHVQQGKSFSQSLEEQPDHFDPLLRAMAAVGEASGNLPVLLSRVHALLEKREKLRKDLLGAMVYPAVVLTMATGIVIFLLTFAVPALEPLLEGQKVEGLTAGLFAASHLLLDHGGVLALLVGSLFFLALFAWRQPFLRKRALLWLSRVPLLGKLLFYSALARSFQTMASLVGGGLNLLDALRLSRGVAGEPRLEAAFTSLEEAMMQGSSLSQSMRASPLFPDMVLRLITLAEEGGNLAAALSQLATLYERDTEKQLQQMQQLMQPCILIFLGFIVGLILMGVLLPLTDVQQLMGGAQG